MAVDEAREPRSFERTAGQLLRMGLGQPVVVDEHLAGVLVLDRDVVTRPGHEGHRLKVVAGEAVGLLGIGPRQATEALSKTRKAGSGVSPRCRTSSDPHAPADEVRETDRRVAFHLAVEVARPGGRAAERARRAWSAWRPSKSAAIPPGPTQASPTWRRNASWTSSRMCGSADSATGVSPVSMRPQPVIVGLRGYRRPHPGSHRRSPPARSEALVPARGH